MTRTEELLAATALLNNLNESRLQLLNGRDVVCKNTHLAGFGGDVDLDDIGRLVDGLSNGKLVEIPGLYCLFSPGRVHTPIHPPAPPETSNPSYYMVAKRT